MIYQEQATAVPQGVGVGRRFVAIIIDSIAIGIIGAIIELLIRNQLVLDEIIIGIITLIYYIVLEATQGATLGQNGPGPACSQPGWNTNYLVTSSYS